jgi:hypothetical protein
MTNIGSFHLDKQKEKSKHAYANNHPPLVV